MNRNGFRQSLRCVCVTLALVIWAGRGVAGLTIGYSTFLDLARPTPAAAAAAWIPHAGSPPAQAITVDGCPALRLQCQLDNPAIARASWDVAVALDLRLVRGLRLTFRCADPAAVNAFWIYLKSGDGWYAASFYPSSPGNWETRELLKADFGLEGRPTGWQRIEVLRFSAWRAGAGKATVELAGLGAIHPRSRIAVVRGVSARDRLTGSDRGGILRYAANVAQALDRCGVNPAFVDDVDLSVEVLQQLALVILPYNPHMPASVARELADFGARGGRIIGFYTFPPTLAETLGMRPGNYASKPDGLPELARIVFHPGALPGAPEAVSQRSWNLLPIQPVAGRSAAVALWEDAAGAKTPYAAIVASAQGAWMSHVYLDQDPDAGARMLLALTGQYAPRAWGLAAKACIDGVADTLGQRDFSSAHAALREAARGNAAAFSALRDATTAYDSAVSLRGLGRAVAAVDQARTAARALEHAFFLVQQPLAGEFRGAWCHRGYGIRGWSWDESVRRLAASGFNAVFPNMASAGVAYYPSEVLPVAADVVERGDQLAACLDACRRYGVQLHLWKVCFRLGRQPAPVLAALRTAGRLAVSYSGHEQATLLCPSHPANQRREAEALAEVVRGYPLDGVHLDYIRYSGADTCFCNGCRQRFEALLGHAVENWPEAVRADDGLARNWLAFRRRNINATVAAVHQAVKSIRGDVKLSAAVFSNWVSARDSVAQDWVAWCRDGYLDFVCPMDYVSSAAALQAAASRQLNLMQPYAVPVYPGIGLRAASGRLSPVELVRQINVTRALGTTGFVVFEYNREEALDVFPLLAKGLTARP